MKVIKNKHKNIVYEEINIFNYHNQTSSELFNKNMR